MDSRFLDTDSHTVPPKVEMIKEEKLFMAS